jgi:hypothetical protein
VFINLELIVMSQYMHQKDVARISAKHVKLSGTWDEVLQLPKKHHGASAQVAIYPYAAIQHPEIDLT